MKRASISFFLVISVCVIALPILALFALLLLQLEDNERQALERRMEREAASVAASAERMLHDMAISLRLVSTSPELLSGDLEAFHQRTRLSLTGSDLFVVLVSSAGRQVVNTRVGFDAPLGMTGNMKAVESVLGSGSLQVSDVFVGKTSGHHVFNVMQPVPGKSPAAPGALIMTRNASDVASLLPVSGLPAGWTSAIADGSGNVVASVGALPMAAGSPLPSPLMARMEQPLGVTALLMGKAQSIAAYAKLNEWPWRAVIWGPVATAQTSILTTWRFLIVGGLGLIALAIGAAVFLARRLENSVLAIAAMADGLARGEIVSPVTSRISELDTVGKAISNASFDRSEAEQQIRLILRELAHRTKNLLTVAQAIIRQTVRQSGDLDEFQTKVDLRLRGLASSIDLLTAENWSRVTLKRLIQTHLSTFADGDGRVEVEGEDFVLRPEAVQNLGLALHELATNAMKYGALSRPEGRVSIHWRWLGGDTLQLQWREHDGPAVKQPDRKGFGTTVVERHAAAAFSGKAELEFAPGGVRWTLVAPRAALETDEAASLAEAELERA